MALAAVAAIAAWPASFGCTPSLKISSGWPPSGSSRLAYGIPVVMAALLTASITDWGWQPYGTQYDFGQGAEQPIIKSASLTVYANGVGQGQINLIGGAFPNRMVSCVLQDADAGTRSGAITIKYDSFLSDRTKIGVRFYDSAGNPLKNLDIAVSYVAMGY